MTVVDWLLDSDPVDPLAGDARPDRRAGGDRIRRAREGRDRGLGRPAARAPGAGRPVGRQTVVARLDGYVPRARAPAALRPRSRERAGPAGDRSRPRARHLAGSGIRDPLGRQPVLPGRGRAMHQRQRRLDRLPTSAWTCRRLVDRLLGEQLPDGGWNCEVENGATVSSFGTTINVLEGLLEHERALGGSAVVAAARRRGEAYMLERGLFRRKSNGEVIDPSWLRFSFPTWYHYDVLRGLDYLRSAGVAPDERVAEALALVEQKRGEDGRWPLENTHKGRGVADRWTTATASRAAGTPCERCECFGGPDEEKTDDGTDHPGPGILARRVGVGRGRGDAAGRRSRRHRPDPARPRVGGRRPLQDHVRGPRRRDRGRRCAPRRRRPSSPLHSATGFSGYAASDLVPERIAAMVYVDTAPGQGRARPDRSRATRSRWCGRRSRRRRTSTG